MSNMAGRAGGCSALLDRLLHAVSHLVLCSHSIFVGVICLLVFLYFKSLQLTDSIQHYVKYDKPMLNFNSKP